MARQDDFIGSMMSEMLGGGWGALEGAETRAREFNAKSAAIEETEQRRQSQIAHAALDNDAGRALLDLLMRKTLLRPPGALELNAATTEAYALAKAKREGQNSVLFMIMEMLEWGRGLDQRETDQ